MKPDKYQEKSDEFSLYKNHNPDTLLYYATALGGEVGELIAAAIVDEYGPSVLDEGGDVLWYIGAVARTIDCPLSKIIGKNDFERVPIGLRPRDIDIHIGKLLNQVKKVVRDDKGDLLPSRRLNIISALKWMLSCLNGYAALAGGTLEDMAKDNLDKLREKEEEGKVTG